MTNWPASYQVRKGILERPIQALIAEAMSLALPADCYFTSIPGGDGKKTQSPGYRSGTPDLLFVYQGRPLFVELKRAIGGVLSQDQRDCHRALERAGASVHTATSLDQVVDLIRDELKCPVRMRI